MEVLKEPPKFTHKAVVTIYSNEDDDEIAFSVDFVPSLTGEDIEELGYLPAAYELVQAYVLPALEQAYFDNEVDPLMKLEGPSKRSH